MGSFSMVLRARAQIVPDWRQVYEGPLARVGAAERLELRVHGITPFVEVLVDDRALRLPDERVEQLQRVVAAALGVTGASVRRLSDEPAWRREAMWFRAWAPAQVGRGPAGGELTSDVQSAHVMNPRRTLSHGGPG